MKKKNKIINVELKTKVELIKKQLNTLPAKELMDLQDHISYLYMRKEGSND